MTIIGTLVKLIKVIAFIALSIVAAAQEKSAPNLPAFVPRFPLPTSGLEWREAATPLKYWDATGRRAAAFGKQDGKFEAWIWPIKVLHGFRLEFRQDGMPEPVRGEAWLREVITRPESTTLVYVHPKFTVREIVWAAPDSPALIVFFDVDSDKPLNITAKFVPDFKPMWPASLGGQHSWWVAEDKAFGLGDAQEKHVALIGSPAVASYTDFMDHSLVGGEMLLGVRVNPHPIAQNQARPRHPETDYAAIVMSLGMSGETEARANYEHAVLNLRDWYEAKTGEWREFLAHTTQLETPDPVLDRAWQWGKVAIHSGWVCTPVPGQELQRGVDRTGCGMIAGYGPAGDGERPGFAWWFGGDGLMATWAMEEYGDLPGALQELRFLKARQREDGKITHEIVQSLGLVDWFKDFHFAYMHADTTPMYLYSVAEYYGRTGDKQFLQEFWPSVKKAYEWSVSVTDPKDGLMDNTKAGLGAIEVGVLKGKVTKDIYLEGFWVGGLQGFAEIAAALGDKQAADDANSRLETAMNSLQTQWWDPEQKYFAFGVTADGQRAMMAGNWPSVLMAYAPLDGQKARAQMERMSLPDLASDWGLRTISDKSPLFDPVSYNNGTVWPMIQTWSTWAQYRWGMPLQGYASLHDAANLTGMQSPGYMPEHMNGTYFETGERSVPHQLFSTVGVLVPMVRGLMGIEVRGDTVRIAPRLPASWPRARISQIAVAGGKLDLEVRREQQSMTLSFLYNGARPLTLEPDIDLPLGARAKSWKIVGGTWKREEKDGRLVSIQFSGTAGGMIEYDYEGGVSVMPIPAGPQLGARTTALKVLGVQQTGNAEFTLSVAGVGGQTYTLPMLVRMNADRQGRLGFTRLRVSTDAPDVRIGGNDNIILEIPFHGTGYVTREIRVRW
jgi:hypothetical protein